METKVWNLVDSSTLCWGANWEGSESSVRALVFGKMVELGKNRIERYQSDLFHDALWLKEMLNGPMQFDWIARHSGTFIGNVCSQVKAEDYENSVYYRFEIIEEDRKWTLNIYEASPLVPIEPVRLCDECGALVGAHYVADMAMWLCSSYCTAKAQERMNNIAWTDRHAALDISECDVAKSIEGCIFHPAPVGGWTMEDTSNVTFYGNDDPDKQTLADAEAALKALDPVNEIIDSLFNKPGYKTEEISVIGDLTSPYDFPTLRNEPNTKEKVNMDSILRDLREKAQDAETAKDDLEGAKYELEEAIGELDEYISSVNDLIDSLDNLPEVSVSVELDVSFDS